MVCCGWRVVREYELKVNQVVRSIWPWSDHKFSMTNLSPISGSSLGAAISYITCMDSLYE